MRDPMKVLSVLSDGIGTFELGIVTELFGLPRPVSTPTFFT